MGTNLGQASLLRGDLQGLSITRGQVKTQRGSGTITSQAGAGPQTQSP